MHKILSATAALLALTGTVTLAAAPAEARYYGGYGGGWHGGYGGGWHGGYYRHGGGAGLAVGAGILGLAAGAAIASRPYYRPSYGPAYYGYGYYPPRRAYWGPPACSPRAYYDGYC